MTHFLKDLSRSRAGLFGFVLLVVIVALALLAPLLELPDPTRGDLRARLAGPTWEGLFSPGAHPLGTDEVGRDILSRLIHGSRMTLMVASTAVVLGGIVGTVLGILAGYKGGFIDRLLMRLVDIQLAIPLMLLALLVVAALGPSIRNVVLVLALTSWIRYARIIRAQVLSLREREFVQSARAIGASTARIMFLHILPNVLTPALVVGTLELARVIIMDAALSFLGLGVQPPTPSWGRMLADGRVYLSSAWWTVTFPGLAIVLTVLSVNLFGDWLRDYFDPKTRSAK
ncbi:putative D,D-dipeptide transport system permease protein DdpC [Pseudooceanicola marinus]|uniref:Putative D,D-dipeptide transport system permease protein DdpC n=1 Tax=Pseudooceanicola marinus TaxID=396013 RepID=A0A1X6YA96_9RHOB|nr:ABC transporter permease [Pseudooceanicola marinus]PJE33198.1 ABC transporter permease [Pseudooceanicola marinus]SLN13526.1 putative D,D-dipeptide transport system permease protein DdpC [Pseudooceanicola marinus]